MNDLAERLRTELPELASGLLGELDQVDHLDEVPTLDPEPIPSTTPLPRRRVLVGTAAAAITAVCAVTGGRLLSRQRSTSITASAEPNHYGSWRAMANAPITPRQHGLAAWNGDAAVFWAGHITTGDNIHAVSTGAFYDPITDSWERAVTSSVAHPGFEGIAVGDEVFATAKSGFVRADLRTGSYTEVPTDPPIGLWSILEIGGRIWGVGYARPETLQSRPEFLAFAEYLVDSNTWGPTTVQKAPAGSNIALLGSEFVSCSDSGTCIFVDPISATDSPGASEDAFRLLDAPNADFRPTMAFAGSDLLALTLATKDGQMREVYRADGEEWVLLDLIPTGTGSAMTLADAGEWLLILSSEQPPVALNVGSGAWHQFEEWPMTGVQNPSTVWTGSELIIWGGQDSQGAEGAIWTPPQ